MVENESTWQKLYGIDEIPKFCSTCKRIKDPGKNIFFVQNIVSKYIHLGYKGNRGYGASRTYTVAKCCPYDYYNSSFTDFEIPEDSELRERLRNMPRFVVANMKSDTWTARIVKGDTLEDVLAAEVKNGFHEVVIFPLEEGRHYKWELTPLESKQ